MKFKLLIALLGTVLFMSCSKEQVYIQIGENPSTRVSYGAERLKAAFDTANFDAVITNSMDVTESLTIRISVAEADSLAKEDKEGYKITRENNLITVVGYDASGALYGCIDLVNMLKDNDHKLPQTIDMDEKPNMVLRGACVGVQKPYYLPGRHVYEYPYTEEVFPWFYDKQLWIEYMDMLVDNKMNSLYLWNGHPFASLVKLEDYPFAVEVDEATFKKNEEMYAFLTQEAEKRGIWVIQMFYNIFVSKPFAEHYGIKTQDRSRPITPLIADYTQKSVAAFIEKYPNVGLLVCLGEAMDTYEDDVQWFTKTIIPGVQDGLKALGRTDEPPIVLRAHDTDAKMVMDAALPIYKNLYTMHKYNGESLTTYEPRGSWTKIHTDLSSLDQFIYRMFIF